MIQYEKSKSVVNWEKFITETSFFQYIDPIFFIIINEVDWNSSLFNIFHPA